MAQRGYGPALCMPDTPGRKVPACPICFEAIGGTPTASGRAPSLGRHRRTWCWCKHCRTANKRSDLVCFTIANEGVNEIELSWKSNRAKFNSDYEKKAEQAQPFYGVFTPPKRRK